MVLKTSHSYSSKATRAIDIPDTSSDTISTLETILTSPQRLTGFEKYLRRDADHKHLVLLEELRQLRYETDPDAMSTIVQRIYHNFIEDGSPWFVDLESQHLICQRLQLMEWQNFTASELISIFEEAEAEIMNYLNEIANELFREFKAPLPAETDGTRKRVVIVGGGFTGCTVASILDPMSRFEVVLIDNKDSFEYTPSLIRNLVSPAHFSSSVRIPHNTYVKNGRVIIGHAHGISSSARHILVNDTEISFDYLVLATGSTYRSQFKSSDTSTLYRSSQIDNESRELRNAKSILIIGGGLVGCELASEVSRVYNGIDRPKKQRITMVDSGNTLVQRSTPKQQKYAAQYLEKLGVEVVLGERVIPFDDFHKGETIYIGASGKRYTGYDKVYFATGTKPASEILLQETDEFANCIDCNGRICVKPTLQVDHWLFQHVFSGGDVTNVKEEKTGYAATLAGVVIARNICRLEKGKQPIRQSECGTIAPPQRPLHGVSRQGGVGKENLTSFKKAFSFLSPNWAALKQFDETQFLSLVSGESQWSSSVIGTLPKKLMLDKRQSANDKREPRNTLHHPLVWTYSEDTLTNSMLTQLS
ncbi:hypothetical protein INT44_007668, partial [Umbelopsis vinacea]